MRPRSTADNTRMQPKADGDVRCECGNCGAHAFANPQAWLSLRCANCDTFELAPLESVKSAQAA
jgi:hypothetical protein